MRRLPLLVLACVLLATRARAAEEPAAHASPCGRQARAALTELACEIARGLGERAQGGLVVSGEPELDGVTRPRAELAVRLAALVAGALGPGASAHPAPALAPRALSSDARPLIVLAPRLRAERLELTADVYVGRRRFWQRLRGAGPGPVAHAFAERALDAEVRSFLPAVPLVARELRKVRGVDGDVVAVACGDATGDGVPELALVGRQRIALGRIRGDAFEPFAQRSFGELANVAPAPLREPLASAWFPAPGMLEVGVTDRARALRLDARLAKLAELEQRLPWPGGGCAKLVELAVAPEPVRCSAREPARTEPRLEEAVDAFAGALVVSKTGAARLVRAGRRPADGAVLVTDGSASVRLARAGAALALSDLDGDGVPELLSSVDTLDRREDALVVHSWVGAELRERLRVPVPSGVQALAVCPARAAGIAPIAIATGDGLWFLR